MAPSVGNTLPRKRSSPGLRLPTTSTTWASQRYGFSFLFPHPSSDSKVRDFRSFQNQETTSKRREMESPFSKSCSFPMASGRVNTAVRGSPKLHCLCFLTLFASRAHVLDPLNHYCLLRYRHSYPRRVEGRNNPLSVQPCTPGGRWLGTPHRRRVDSLRHSTQLCCAPNLGHGP